jgi:hypothetical protein
MPKPYTKYKIISSSRSWDNWAILQSPCPFVHPFVTDISASSGRNDFIFDIWLWHGDLYRVSPFKVYHTSTSCLQWTWQVPLVKLHLLTQGFHLKPVAAKIRRLHFTLPPATLRITRCCTLRRAKNTPTRSFVSRTVNWCSNPLSTVLKTTTVTNTPYNIDCWVIDLCPVISFKMPFICWCTAKIKPTNIGAIQYVILVFKSPGNALTSITENM